MQGYIFFRKCQFLPYLFYHIVKFLPHFTHTFFLFSLNFFPNFNFGWLVSLPKKQGLCKNIYPCFMKNRLKYYFWHRHIVLQKIGNKLFLFLFFVLFWHTIFRNNFLWEWQVMFMVKTKTKTTKKQKQTNKSPLKYKFTAINLLQFTEHCRIITLKGISTLRI